MPAIAILEVAENILMKILFSVFISICVVFEIQASEEGLFRAPDVSKTDVVFVYGTNLWKVSREGGEAVPVVQMAGSVSTPRFSPDGTQIAFTSDVDGGTDIYTIGDDSRIPQRITHHPGRELLLDWNSDGRLMFARSAGSWIPKVTQLYTVSSKGGLPERVAVPFGGVGTLEGDRLVYTFNSRDSRNWKRYTGGTAADIWLYDIGDNTSKRLTNWKGTDTFPMLRGDSVYYLTDRGPNHRLNIWRHDLKSGKDEALTEYDDYDVRYPAMGPGPDGDGEIVFQYGGKLHLLDLKSEDVTKLKVTVPGDRAQLRDQLENVSQLIQHRAAFPNGKRVVVEARGDIWSLPVGNGSKINLTHSSGSAERRPSVSPDGKTVAYFSDASGEYQLVLHPLDGIGQPQVVTNFRSGFKSMPVWSPDSKYMTFTDGTGILYLHDVEDEDTIEIIQDIKMGNVPHAWAPDSRSIVYSVATKGNTRQLWHYEVSSDKTTRLTSGWFDDHTPAFSPDGQFLYFISNRQFKRPTQRGVGLGFTYEETSRIIAVPLNSDVKVPWLAREDGRDGRDDQTTDDKKGKKSKKDKEKKIVVVDLDPEGFERRSHAITTPPGHLRGLGVDKDGKLIYVRQGKTRSIRLLDIFADKIEEKEIMAGDSFSVLEDRSEIFVSAKGKYGIVKIKPDQKLKKPISFEGLTVTVNRREEWHQLVRDSWRFVRDDFYDPNMHGIDWEDILEHYEPLVGACQSRSDLNYVIGEMLGELNVGHAYHGGGDADVPKGPRAGVLAVDWEIDDGAYRIKKFYEGDAWDTDARNPLRVQGLNIKKGTYILAVNGRPLSVEADPWKGFQGLAGKAVTLKIASSADGDNARQVTVRMLKSDQQQRLRSWIVGNRKKVLAATDGRVGYLHVPNTGIDGQNELFRQFYAQQGKDALIIDERWNSGGQVPDHFVDLLNKTPLNYWSRRHGMDWHSPWIGHFGPKCMLINFRAGSGGDAFPRYFRQRGAGKLIGTRTWGGLVGLTGAGRLIDGGRVNVPNFAFYDIDGTWGVEGYGVKPDIEIVADPAKMRDGGDPQLEKAIEVMLEELKNNPYVKPKRPEYPDRRGIDLPKSDQ